MRFGGERRDLEEDDRDGNLEEDDRDGERESDLLLFSKSEYLWLPRRLAEAASPTVRVIGRGHFKGLFRRLGSLAGELLSGLACSFLSRFRDGRRRSLERETKGCFRRRGNAGGLHHAGS